MTSLRQRLIEERRVRHLSPHTERASVETVARFARDFGRSPAVLGPDEIRADQVSLTTERRLAPSSLGIAVSALRLLDTVTLKQPWSFADVIPTPKKPRPLPIGLSPDAVHVLESGTDVVFLQLLLGPRDLGTTARDRRIATTTVCSTTSPRDLLPRPTALPASPPSA